MPVMDGLESSTKIIKLNTNIPIIALTANIMPNELEVYKNTGIDDFLGKPFTSQELWHCLMKYLKPIAWRSVNGTHVRKSESELKSIMLSEFIQANQTKFLEITQAINAGDIKLAHRMTHNLKSNAAYLNKVSLQHAAQAVESQLRDGKDLTTPEQMTLLKNEINSALADFAAELKYNFVVQG